MLLRLLSTVGNNFMDLYLCAKVPCREVVYGRGFNVLFSIKLTLHIEKIGIAVDLRGTVILIKNFSSD